MDDQLSSSRRTSYLEPLAATPAAPKLDLAVSADASFTIHLDGQLWLSGSEYAVAGLSSSAGGTSSMTRSPSTQQQLPPL